jgi:hypothetical protein
MDEKRLRQIESEIEKIKRDLRKIGEMRPGSLSKQYRVPQKQIGPFWQLSYTHKMKSHTEYVRHAFIKELKKQIASYRTFRKLVTKWRELAIEHSKTKIRLAKRNHPK